MSKLLEIAYEHLTPKQKHKALKMAMRKLLELEKQGSKKAKAALDKIRATKDDLVKELIGKNPEGQDLYEDSRGIRFYKQGETTIYENVAISGGNLDLSGRTDEHCTVEEVAVINPKPTTKNESRLIEIDDELDSALDDLAAVFKEHGKRLSSGVDPEILQDGFDPELLIDGITIAGAYVESGVRQFSDYAKAMIDDMGNNVKPYLLSFWEGVRHYPSLDTKGMTDPIESKRQFDELNTQTTGDKNEFSKLDKPSKKPLEGVSSNNVQGTGSQRPTTGEARGSGGTNLSGNERIGGTGLSTTRIMGDDTGEVSDTARGKGAERLAATPAQELATDFVTQDEGQYRWWWPQTVDESLQSVLAVQTTESEMTPQLHNLLMESKLRRLIQEDETPRETMMMSVEQFPEMYQIAQDTEVRNYVTAIMWSDSMGALLSKIIWPLETTEIQESQQETIQEWMEEQSLMSIIEKM